MISLDVIYNTAVCTWISNLAYYMKETRLYLDSDLLYKIAYAMKFNQCVSFKSIFEAISSLYKWQWQ